MPVHRDLCQGIGVYAWHNTSMYGIVCSHPAVGTQVEELMKGQEAVKLVLALPLMLSIMCVKLVLALPLMFSD